MESDGCEDGIYTKNTLIAFFVITTVVCLGLSHRYAPEDWSMLRIVAAGLFGGAWSFYCVFINHLLARPLEA